MANDLGLDKSTVVSRMGKLAEMGEVTITRGRCGQRNTYALAKESVRELRTVGVPYRTETSDSNRTETPTVPYENSVRKRTETSDTYKNKKKRKNKKEDTTIDLPFELDTPAFRETWGSYIQHRKEKRSTLTPTATARALKQCEAWGEARAIAAIEHSITMGWTGIFEDKGKAGKRDDEPETEEQFQARMKRVFDKAKKEKDNANE